MDGIHHFKSLVNVIPETVNQQKVDAVWISGWFERGPCYLYSLLHGLKKKACTLIYDPIDPIYEYVLSALPAMGFIKRQFHRFVLKLCYRQCRFILAVTPQIKRTLSGYGLPEENIEVAMWGTDIDRFDIQKLPKDNPFRALPQLKDKLVIGWLGSMSIFKGIEEVLIPLIEKLSHLRNRVAFLLAGSGPLSAKLAGVAERLPSDYVTVLGGMPYHQAPSFTAALDCYVVPTNPNKPLGNSIVPVKIFDALAIGVPVIATRSDATDALSDDLKGLTLVEWGNDHLKDAMGRVIGNYQLFKRRAVSGLEQARLYSHQHIAKSTVARLEAVLL